MPTDQTPPQPPANDRGEYRGSGKLTPTAECSLAEAAARHAEHERKETEPPKESGGRGGLEPTRYGDWEINGLAADF